MASLDSIASAGAASGVKARPGVLSRLLRNKSALIGGSIVLLFVLMAVLAPILPLARAVGMLEQLSGVLYVAMVISRLVSMSVLRRS